MFNYATKSVGKKKYNENLSAKIIFHSTIDQFDHIFILFPLQVVPDWPRYQVSQATFKFPYATISGHWHNEKETWPTKNRVPRGEDKGRRGEEGKNSSQLGWRPPEGEEWRALNGKTPFRGKFENSLKRGQLRRRIRESRKWRTWSRLS